MAENVLGLNFTFPIYNEDGTPFHDLVLKKATFDGVVMSLGHKITGDVYYRDNTLEVTNHEYIEYKRDPNDPNEDTVKYVLVNPPTIVREGMVSDNGDLKGMTKYSFEFYHPMYTLTNMPFSDVAVTEDEERYLSQNKTFSWVGDARDYVAKLNANLKDTEWVCRLSDSLYVDGEPTSQITTLCDVLSFSDNSIADAIKLCYDTFGISYVVDQLDATDEDYPSGKRFLVLFGLPSNEIYEKDYLGRVVTDYYGNPVKFIFRFGQGVGLKNNSRTPRNNKIVTRIAGYGSTSNIPYGYPQIVWYGDSRWDYTAYKGDTIIYDENDKVTNAPADDAYTLYKGIVGGAYVKLIKHPFTREHLMPTIYADCVFNKVSPYIEGGSVNPHYNPQLEIKDYYDAIATQEFPFENEINPSSPSYEIHAFEDIKPELGSAEIVSATPLDDSLHDIDTWDYTMDENGEYHPSYFRITLPQLTFDLYACAAITEEMFINMRGGACQGCTFPVQVDWEDYKRNFYDEDGNFVPDGSQRDLTKYPKSNEGSISVIVQKEYATFGTLMPNPYQYPKPNDAFVILGISLPLSYIEDAEERLDLAMMSYMLENNVYYYDYPLKFDEYFLANNQQILAQLKLNTIVRFEFVKGEEPLQLFVKQLTIKYGQSPLPQYDITLTDDVDVVLNQIGQVIEDVGKISSIVSLLRQNFSNAGLSIAQVKSLIDSYGSERFLSKIRNDIATGIVGFLNGLWVKAQNLFGIDGNGNATLNDVRAEGDVLIGENPSDSILDGSGTIIKDGRVQADDVEVRGALKVLDLVASQIHSLDGYYYFSDTMKIAKVVEDHEHPNQRKIYFEKEYDNDFIKFYQNDILLSAQADLDSTLPPTISPAGNTYRNVSMQSWMNVLSTGTDEGGIYAIVNLYDPTQVPTKGAYVARRGNNNSYDPSMQSRRDSWCISVEEGRIVYYINQSTTSINDNNYGLAIGRLPDIAPVRNIGAVGEVGVYAKYLLAQHLISVEYVGDTQYVTIDEGDWDADKVALDTYYCSRIASGGITTITKVKVRHNFCEWLCVKGESESGKHVSTLEPSINTLTDWTLISGGDQVTGVDIEFATTKTEEVPEYDDTTNKWYNDLGLGLGEDEVTWYSDQSDCEYNALYPYMWKKTTTYTIGNPLGDVAIELIGVYGETGLQCHVTMDKELLTVSVDGSGHPKSAVSEKSYVHLWLDTEEIAINPIIDEESEEESEGESSAEDSGIVIVDNPSNLDVAVGSDENGTYITLSMATTDTIANGETQEVEIRVQGDATINGVTSTFSRLFTWKIIGVKYGEDAEAPLDVRLDRETILVPTDTDPNTGVEYIWDTSTIRIVGRSYSGNTQLVVPYSAYVSATSVVYHGGQTPYLRIATGNYENYVDITYIGEGNAQTGETDRMSASDWAEVFVTYYFPSQEVSFTKVVTVYPNPAGTSSQGLDAISVRMQPDTLQFPVYDNKTVAVNGLTLTPIAFRGDVSVNAVLTSVTVTYKTSRQGVTVPSFLEASVAQGGGSAVVNILPNQSVDASADYATLSFSYTLNGKSYSGLLVDVRPYKLDVPVQYTISAQDVKVGNIGGQPTIRPNILPISLTRTYGSTSEFLDTDAKIAQYMDASNSYVDIYDGNGNRLARYSVTTNSTSLANYASTIDHIVIRFTDTNGNVTETTIQVTRDGSAGRPLVTRLWVNVLEEGFIYRNESLVTNPAVGGESLYIDYIAVEDAGLTSGYDVYEVNTAGDATQVTPEETVDLTTYDIADRITYMASLGFMQVRLNVSSAWFTTLFAKNANIRMLNGANITLTNSQNQIVAGMSNGRVMPNDSKAYHFWSGGARGDLANFSVDTQGNMVAKNADILGKIVGSLRNPFARKGMEASSYSSDNIALVPISGDPGADATYYMQMGSNPALSSGRTIRLVAGLWGESRSGAATVYFKDSSDNIYPIFENGGQVDHIAIENQVVELVGYGTPETFNGWIVLNRIDLLTNAKFGAPAKALIYGKLDGTTNGFTTNFVKAFDGSTITRTREGVGLYKVTIPTSWKIILDRMHVSVTPIGLSRNSGNPQAIPLCIVDSIDTDGGYVSAFTLRLSSDRGHTYDGCVTFAVYNMDDWY